MVDRRLMLASLAVLGGVLAALACGRGAAPVSQPVGTAPVEAAVQPPDQQRSLSVGGQQRSYLLHLPAVFDPARPAPLVLVFHGIGLNGQEMVRITGFNQQADLNGFIVVYPEGTGRQPSWNGGDCCGEAAAKQVDDVGFVRTLLDDLGQVARIDPQRVYATGFSNGAIMAYRLGCDLADRIAAIGPVGAAQATLECVPARPLPVIHFHGDADRLNPYLGGPRPGGLTFRAVEENVGWWVDQNGCQPQPSETQTGNIVHRVFSGCTAGAGVELYKILGGEHAWPGGEAVSAEVGQPTTEITATPLIWAFFAAHPLP